MKMKKITALALAGIMAIGGSGAGVLPVRAAEPEPTVTTDYVLTIPSSLNVTSAGWNDAGGITATVRDGDSFNSEKKLTVTATSDNGTANVSNAWKLVSGTNTVGYNLVATGDNNSVYKSAATPATWEFSADELNKSGGAKKDMGIVVEDYSEKPVGSYTDTVTFTASVADGVKTYTGLSETVPTVIGLGEKLVAEKKYYNGVNLEVGHTYELVRAQIGYTTEGESYKAKVTESESGYFYVLKDLTDNSYPVYWMDGIGASGWCCESNSSSDGMQISYNSGSWKVSTHNPQTN